MEYNNIENNNDRQYVINTIFNLLYAIANKNDRQPPVGPKKDNHTRLLGKRALSSLDFAIDLEKNDLWHRVPSKYEEALDFINQMDDTDNHTYAKALILNNLALAENNIGDLISAHKHIKETVEILNHLTMDPENLKPMADYNLKMIEEIIATGGQPDDSTIFELIYNESLKLNEKDSSSKKHNDRYYSSSKDKISKNNIAQKQSTKNDDTISTIIMICLILIFLLTAFIIYKSR